MKEKKLFNNIQFLTLINKIYHLLQNGYKISLFSSKENNYQVIATNGKTKENINIDNIFNKYPEIQTYLLNHPNTTYIIYYDNISKEYICNIKTEEQIEKINIGANNIIEILTNLKDIIKKPQDEQKKILKKTLLKDKNSKKHTS